MWGMTKVVMVPVEADIGRESGVMDLPGKA
jgi:hypothetical protein